MCVCVYHTYVCVTLFQDSEYMCVCVSSITTGFCFGFVIPLAHKMVFDVSPSSLV